MSFDSVDQFEKRIADFYGAPYAIATDCCTHAIELCLRYLDIKRVTIPKYTYLSVPMILKKLNIEWNFNDEMWTDYYEIKGTNIIDAAVLWRENSYIPNTFMCLSFQFQKHLSLGRGGMILCDNKTDRDYLIKMTYDGRTRNIPWKDQNIETIGYHYYMTPETAQLGLEKFLPATIVPAKEWTWKNYPDLSKMEIFNDF